MDLEVSVRAADVLRGLGLAEKRTQYAVVNALNKTIKLVQERQRSRVRGQFTVRKPDFLLRQAAVIKGRAGGSGFASVKEGRLEARVMVGERPRLLLGRFEAGGTRGAFKGKNVAVPLRGGPARPTKRSAVPEPFTFKGLRFVKGQRRSGGSRRVKGAAGFRAVRGKKGTIQWKGERRTFILPRSARAPEGGVFQRIGPGRDDVRMIYSFVREVRIAPVLKFVETARRTASAAFPPALLAEISATIKHAFGRTGTL